MLTPRKVKYRKHQRGGRLKGISKRGTRLAFGEFGMKAQTFGLINAREIEAARRAMTRYVQKGGKIWIRIFPDKPVTSKPAEVRQGKGKGSLSHYVAAIKPGRVMFEADGVPMEVAKEAMRLAAQKLPVKTKFVLRRDFAE